MGSKCTIVAAVLHLDFKSDNRIVAATQPHEVSSRTASDQLLSFVCSNGNAESCRSFLEDMFPIEWKCGAMIGMYDEHGRRTRLGIGVSASAFLITAASGLLLVLAFFWALLDPFGCETSCATVDRAFVAMVMICPVTLTVAVSTGSKAAFGKASSSMLALLLQSSASMRVI